MRFPGMFSTITMMLSLHATSLLEISNILVFYTQNIVTTDLFTFTSPIVCDVTYFIPPKKCHWIEIKCI